MKKRIFTLLLAFIMLVGMLPVNAFATEVTEPGETTVVLCETEGCEYVSGHEGECSNETVPDESEIPVASEVASEDDTKTAGTELTAEETVVEEIAAGTVAVTAENGIESDVPVLNFMVNGSSNAANSDPQKALLGEDGILRIENRTAKPKYLWVGAENGATVTKLEFLQGLEASNITPEPNKRTSNNEYDGTTYQAYYYSGKYKLPMVLKATLTAADGVTTASYYIIVTSDTAGQYVSGITGFTADNDTYYNPASGISFTEADSKVT